MEIQTFMKGRLCYTTSDNAEVTLRHAVFILLVSAYTHQLCIHKYLDFQYWWTAVAWYLTDEVKSNRILKKLVTHVLFYVKSWMTVDKPRTAELY